MSDDIEEEDFSKLEATAIAASVAGAGRNAAKKQRPTRSQSPPMHPMPRFTAPSSAMRGVGAAATIADSPSGSINTSSIIYSEGPPQQSGAPFHRLSVLSAASNTSNVRFASLKLDEIVEEVLDEDLDGYGVGNGSGGGRSGGTTDVGCTTPPTPPESAFYSSFGGTYDSGVRPHSTQSLLVSPSNSNSKRAAMTAAAGIAPIVPVAGGTSVSTASGATATAPAGAAATDSRMASRAAHRLSLFDARRSSLNTIGGTGAYVEESIDEDVSEVLCMRGFTHEPMIVKLFAVLGRGAASTLYEAVEIPSDGSNSASTSPKATAAASAADPQATHRVSSATVAGAGGALCVKVIRCLDNRLGSTARPPRKLSIGIPRLPPPISLEGGNSRLTSPGSNSGALGGSGGRHVEDSGGFSQQTTDDSANTNSSGFIAAPNKDADELGRGDQNSNATDDNDDDDDDDVEAGSSFMGPAIAALNFEKLSLLKREITAVSRLVRNDHARGILPYYGMLQRDEHLYIVSHNAIGGSLSGFLDRLGHGLPVIIVEQLALTLLEAVAALHGAGLTHKAIDCSSVLIDLAAAAAAHGSGAEPPRITDVTVYLGSFSAHHTSSLALGSSSSAQDGSLSGSSSPPGSPRRFHKPTDLWAAACTVLELLIGKPLHSAYRSASMGQLLAPPLPEAGELWGSEQEGLPADVADFFNSAFTLSHIERPTAEELLSSAWMTAAKRRRAEYGADPRAAELKGTAPAEIRALLGDIVGSLRRRAAAVRAECEKHRESLMASGIFASLLASTSNTNMNNNNNSMNGSSLGIGAAPKLSPSLSPQVSGILSRSPSHTSGGNVSPMIGGSGGGPSSPFAPGPPRLISAEASAAGSTKRAPRQARVSLGVPPIAPVALQTATQPPAAQSGVSLLPVPPAGAAPANAHITPRRIVKN